MTDSFVIVDVPPPNIVVVEQQPPNFVLVDDGGGGGVITGVLSFDGRAGAVGFELADAELIFTANGQLLVGTGTHTGDLLSPGSDGDVLTMVSGSPAWASGGGGGGGVTEFNTRTGNVVLDAADLEAIFTAKGQILVGSGSGTGGFLTIGSSGDVLTVVSGTAAWAPSSGGGGGYDSLTGAGESASPGDLTQAGGFQVISPSGTSLGVALSDDSSSGIALVETSTGGILIIDEGSGGVTVESSGSGGIQIQDSSNGGINITEVTGGTGITITDGSTGGILIHQTSTGELTLQASGGGPMALNQDDDGGFSIFDAGTGADSIILPNLPTTDPAVTGQFWSDSGNVVLSGFSGGSGFTAGGDLSGSSTSQEVVGLLSIAFSGTPSSGDTIEYDGTNFVFSTPIAGTFPTLSGTGTPEGSQNGSPGDSYEDINTGALYWKFSGSGTDTGWVTGVGTPVDFGGSTPIPGVGFFSNEYLFIVGGALDGVAITDVPARGSGGTSNGLFWESASGDGSQFLSLQTGSTGQYAWNFESDGDTFFPGPIQIDATVHESGVGATLNAYPGDPNTHITSVSKGDLVLDTSTPALWQAGTASSNSSWVNISTGGGGGGYLSLTGAGETATPGDLTQAGGFVVNSGSGSSLGIQLTDDSSSGIGITAEDAGISITKTGSAGTSLTIANTDTVGGGILISDQSGGGVTLQTIGTGALTISGEHGAELQTTGSSGATLVIASNDTGGISFEDNGGGGIFIAQQSSNNAVLQLSNTDTGGTSITDYHGGLLLSANDTGVLGIIQNGSGGIEIQDFGAGTDLIVLPNLPTSDPLVTGQMWNSGDVVVLSGYTGGGGGGVASFNTRSGVVTFELADAETIFTADGDLLIGTGSGTGVLLPIGTSGQVLTVVSGEPAWASGGGGGGFPDLTGSGSPLGTESASLGQWYEDTSGATTGIYTKTTDIVTNAQATGDVAPTYPLMVVMGTNDEFVYTPIQTGIPETFTIAPGTYTGNPDLEVAIAAAIGSASSEPFSTYCSDVNANGTQAHVLAGSAPTLPLTVASGVNDTFIFTPFLTGVPETFTVAPATYTTLNQLVFTGLQNAVGSAFGEHLGSVVGMQTQSSKIGMTHFIPGTWGNGDTLTTGPTDILASLGFTSPATFAGGVDGPFFFYLNTGGILDNGDHISFGANDVAADLGFTSNPNIFTGGYGFPEDGWMQAGGLAAQGENHYGLSAQQFFIGELRLLSHGRDLVISDVDGQNLFGNGIYWITEGAGNDQELQIGLGSTAQYPWTFGSDGITTTPGPLVLDAVVDGGSATLFSYPGNPNSHVTSSSVGDLVIDTSSPGLWQAGSPSVDNDWIAVGGGGGGGFPEFGGSGSPDGVQAAFFGQWYEDTSHGTSGIFVKTDAESAYAFGDGSVPTFPVTVVTGTNDEFVFTPAATGTPETFTMAPGVYSSINLLATAINNATGTSSDIFSDWATANVVSNYAPAAAFAITDPTPFTVTTGVNDTFIFTPITTGTPETFTVAAGTYTSQSDLADALAQATGTGSDQFGDYLYSYDTGGTDWWLELEAGDNTNGDTLTTGPTDILAPIGFTSPVTFSGGIPGWFTIQAANSGSADNTDIISAGTNDVSADLGIQGVELFGGYGGTDYGWMQIGGHSTTPTFGVSGDFGTLSLLAQTAATVISDTFAQNGGSGNGIYWNANGEDHQQYLYFQINSLLAGHEWFFGDFEGVSYSDFPGSISTPVVNVVGSTPYLMNGNEGVVISDGQVTLPDPNVAYQNQIYIKDSGAGTATVLPHGVETIDGAPSINLPPSEAVLVTNDGTNWWIIGTAA